MRVWILPYWFWTLCAAVLAAEPGYHIESRIDGPDGGFDYVSVDSGRQRLFVAREYGVMAVDLATGKVTAKLVAGADDSAVLLIPGTTEMLSTNWGRNTATIFDRSTGVIRSVLALGEGPDAAVFNEADKLAYIMNSASRDVSVVDVAAAHVVTTIPLHAKPEAAAVDGDGHVFVNLEDQARIAVIDTGTRRVVAHLALPGCIEPTGLAFDPMTRLLIAACHNGVAKLIHAVSGEDRGTVGVGLDADGTIFDATRRLVYIPGGDGVLTIFRLSTTGRATLIASLATVAGARTAALDEKSGRIYLAAGADSATRSPTRKQFQILVIAP